MNKIEIRIFKDISVLGMFSRRCPQKESLEKLIEYIETELNKIIYK